MAKVVHKIKEYEITGTVGDNGWLYANRELLESYIRDDMRTKDILPILDMPMKLSCSFNEDENVFEFTVKAAGCEVLNAQDYMGIIISDGVIVNNEAKKVLFCETL